MCIVTGLLIIYIFLKNSWKIQQISLHHCSVKLRLNEYCLIYLYIYKYILCVCLILTKNIANNIFWKIHCRKILNTYQCYYLHFTSTNRQFWIPFFKPSCILCRMSTKNYYEKLLGNMNLHLSCPSDNQRPCMCTEVKRTNYCTSKIQ